MYLKSTQNCVCSQVLPYYIENMWMQDKFQLKRLYSRLSNDNLHFKFIFITACIIFDFRDSKQKDNHHSLYGDDLFYLKEYR